MKSLAEALVDKRKELASIVTALGSKKTHDYSIRDKDGKHPTISYLSLLRYGISGPTFEEIALLLQDTASLDK